jgi:hypothetical protein
MRKSGVTENRFVVRLRKVTATRQIVQVQVQGVLSREVTLHVTQTVTTEWPQFYTLWKILCFMYGTVNTLHKSDTTIYIYI